MNKNTLKYTIAYILPTLILLSLAGCGLYSRLGDIEDKQKYDRKTRQVKMLDLHKMQTSTAGKTGKDPNAAPPPAELTLTLQQCRAIALENNLDIKIEQFNPQLADESIGEAKAVFEPVFFSRFDFNKNDTPSGSPITDTLDSSQTQGVSVNTGMNIPLPTGGEITLAAPVNQYVSDYTQKIQYEEIDDNGQVVQKEKWITTEESLYITDLAFSFTQPLLKGGGIKTNTNRIKISHYNQKISQAQTKMKIIAVITNVDIAWWQLFAAREQLKVTKLRYDMAEKHLETTKRLVKAAQIPEVEILRAKTTMTMRKDAIIQQLGTCRQVERELKRILNKPGLDIDSPTILICDIDPNPMEYQLDADKLIDHALQHRMELLILELQLLSSDQTIDYRKNDLLPSLALSYRYNINALGSSLGDSYDLLKRNRFADHALGLQLGIPLGNQAAQSRLDQALLQRKQMLITQKNREFLIKQDVLNALDNLNTNWNRLLTARESTILAGRTLAAEERQYKQGLQSSINVLDAQEKYAENRDTEIQVLTDYYISQIRLAAAGGCLIGTANIDID